MFNTPRVAAEGKAKKVKPLATDSHHLSGSTGVFALNLKPPEIVSGVKMQHKPDLKKERRKVRDVIPKDAFHVSMHTIRAEQEVLPPDPCIPMFRCGRVWCCRTP